MQEEFFFSKLNPNKPPEVPWTVYYWRFANNARKKDRLSYYESWEEMVRFVNMWYPNIRWKSASFIIRSVFSSSDLSITPNPKDYIPFFESSKIYRVLKRYFKIHEISRRELEEIMEMDEFRRQVALAKFKLNRAKFT